MRESEGGKKNSIRTLSLFFTSFFLVKRTEKLKTATKKKKHRFSASKKKQPTTMAPTAATCIGIDLGTTYS